MTSLYMTRAPRTTSKPSLVRIDAQHGGWQVRWYPTADRREYESLFFADKRYGGSRIARRLAKAFMQSIRAVSP